MAAGWVVGIDGGATRTRYLLLDPAGGTVGRREGEGSLLGAGADAEVAARIAQEVRVLVEGAGASLPLSVLCAGLAGAAGRPGSREGCEARLLAFGLAKSVRVLSDAEVAFADAFGTGRGILLVAGTGSVGMARAGEVGTAELQRIGGWGALLGDEGSGYRIGLEGVRGALAGADGRGPETGLTGRIFGALDVEGPRALFDWSERAEKSDFAALAPEVLATAAAADPVAVAIRAGAIEGVLAHARALRLGVFPDQSRVPVALVGGLIEEGGALREAVVQGLMEEGFLPHSEPVDGARGAAGIARLQLPG